MPLVYGTSLFTTRNRLPPEKLQIDCLVVEAFVIVSREQIPGDDAAIADLLYRYPIHRAVPLHWYVQAV